MEKKTELIPLLKLGDEKTIRNLYNDNRNGFLLFANRYDLDKEDVLDVYQDAFVVLCENVKKGKFDGQNSSITTYLFGIGKYMIFERLRKRNHKIPLESLEKMDFDTEDYNEESLDLQVISLKKSFKKLGEQCRKILTLFYYEEKKLDEIVLLLEYTNKDVLKSQKSRCLKQLKDLTKE